MHAPTTDNPSQHDIASLPKVGDRDDQESELPPCVAIVIRLVARGRIEQANRRLQGNGTAYYCSGVASELGSMQYPGPSEDDAGVGILAPEEAESCIEYLSTLRWDCDESNQIWASYSDVTIKN